MTSKVSFKTINKLAIPSIIAGVSEPLLSIVDTAVIGNIQSNSTEALAAVGIVGSFIAAIVWVLAQTRSAIAAIIAQYVGENNIEKIASLPGQIIFINVGISFLIYILTIFLTNQIFSFYNAEGLVLEYASSYYRIRAIGFPFSLFIFTIFGVFAGLQNTFWPMFISIIGTLVNVILDIVLVYGIENLIPPMHIEGAAYASLIAQILMALVAFYLFCKKTPFKLRFQLPLNFEIQRLGGLSVNLFLRALSLHFTMYLANSYAVSYGASYIAAFTISFQIWLFFSFFIDGYANVGGIISGKQKGAKDILGLKFLIKDISRLGVVISLFLVIICFGAYDQIGKIFTQDENVLVVFYGIFWLVLGMQPINALAFVYDGIFKGLAEAKVLRNTLIIATFLGFIPALWICNLLNLKLLGIWISFSVWMFLRFGILAFFFKRKYKIQ